MSNTRPANHHRVKPAGDSPGQPINRVFGRHRFKAQNNTLAVYVNPYEIAKFAARLDYEHVVAASQPQPNFTAAAAATPPGS